jgi:hypothetical protein
MGTHPFAHVTWCGCTSLPLALKTSSFALAGSIPTQFGKLINMEFLHLNHNQLMGTHPFAHVTWCGSTSLPLQSRGGGGGGGGRGGGGASAGGVASGVASHRERKDVHRRTFCVVPTWRTGQEGFRVLVKKKLPSCCVSV